MLKRIVWSERSCIHSLGSIKAACSLEDILKTLSVKVTVVVTMCAHEMKIQGAPEDWTQCFQQESLSHQVSVAGHDIEAAATLG